MIFLFLGVSSLVLTSCNSGGTVDQASMALGSGDSVSLGKSKNESDILRAAREAEAADEEMSLGKRLIASATTKKGELFYIVQVGTFRVESNAKSIVNKLRSVGLPVMTREAAMTEGSKLFIVRFEPTPSKAEAENFVQKTKEITGQTAQIKMSR